MLSQTQESNKISYTNYEYSSLDWNSKRKIWKYAKDFWDSNHSWNVRDAGYRWVFAWKRNEIVRYKARIVAQGFSQRSSIEFEET